ncbi:uncharacterized protein LOC117301164 [Asterias rubens]|uniref:uncharacterized protein LOC117301164 n=1 Tax=Asterias rubens TaxID=7604 RepID=UPI0014553C6C|nr:uncharacterized protein LOC117301164 [Asterias rubens]
MFARPVSDITWSNESYNTRELMSRYPAPLLVRVTHGHCGLQDSDSLGQGQVIRIHRWLKQQRVIAMDARGRYLSIPLDFEIPIEVVPDKRRTLSKLKTMPIAGIIRQFSLPKKVRFSLSHVKSLKDVGQFGIRLPLEPIDLLRLQQEVYLNGNAVNFGELDAAILSIPIHHELEMSVAMGLSSGDRNWHRLMRGLDNVVATRVRFTVHGNKKITIFYSKSEDANIIKKETRKSIETPVVQKRQQSLGRAFYYGTLQRIKAKEKARPISHSVDMGVLDRATNQDSSDGHAQTMSLTKFNIRQRFAKRKDPKLTRTNTDSLSGTSTNVSETTTEDSEQFWSNGFHGDDDDDDDKSEITQDDDVTEDFTPRSLFGSVSRLSLFRPANWSAGGTSNDAGIGSHQPKGWKAMKDKHNARKRRGSIGSLSMGTSISMGDLNSLGRTKRNSEPVVQRRGRPDGRSVVSDDDVEESTDL